MPETWRRCSACKKDIPLGGVHYVCSVSTCNRKRTGLVFCSVDCWEVHLPTERHREAWAVEARAPATAEVIAPANPSAAQRPRTPSAPTRTGSGSDERSTSSRTIIRKRSGQTSEGPTTAGHVRPESGHLPKDDGGEILVVASRLKQYVKEASGFNTSDRVLPLLSTALCRICDEAIENARRAERLTVLDRDVPRS